MKCKCLAITELDGAEAKQYADQHLLEVTTDAVNWTVEYVCPETKRRFLLDYPQSELHGGGPPRLTPMDRK